MRLALLLLLLLPRVACAAVDLLVPDAALCWPAESCTPAGLAVGYKRAVGQLALTAAVECPRGSLDCAARVIAVVLTRRAVASTAQVQISVQEILGTPKQFSGLESSALLRRPLELSERAEAFRRTAADAVNGLLSPDVPRSTHYATCRAMRHVAWGRAALRTQDVISTSDGHCWVNAVLPFPLPPRADKRAAWSATWQESPRVMASLYGWPALEQALRAAQLRQQVELPRVVDLQQSRAVRP